MTTWPASSPATPTRGPHSTTCRAAHSISAPPSPSPSSGTSPTPSRRWRARRYLGRLRRPTPEVALWPALCTAPDEGADIADLMRASGMGRSTLYRYVAQLAEAGRAIQVGWGRWRAATLGDDHDE